MGQGATGIIVRCEDVLSIERLARNSDEGEDPELPAVYVSKEIGTTLDERGITLTGAEFRKKYMTNVMRSIGKAGANPDVKAVGDVLRSVGVAMLERKKEKKAAGQDSDSDAEYEYEQEEVAQEEEKNYKWKVNANTHYLWSRSGGGATVVNVNFGKAAPPSALRKTKICAKTGKEL